MTPRARRRCGSANFEQRNGPLAFDRHDAIPIVGGRVLDRRLELDARVVHEDVELPEPFGRLVDQAPRAVGITHVGDDRRHPWVLVDRFDEACVRAFPRPRVAARLQGPGRSEVGLDPVDALGDVRPQGLGGRPGGRAGGRGEVDRGDLPSARGKPKRCRTRDRSRRRGPTRGAGSRPRRSDVHSGGDAQRSACSRSTCDRRPSQKLRSNFVMSARGEGLFGTPGA